MTSSLLLWVAAVTLPAAACLITIGTVQHQRHLHSGGPDRGVGLIITGTAVAMLPIFEALDLWLGL